MPDRNLKAIIRITDKCNLNCTYCYVAEEVRKTSKIRLGLDSLARFYDQTLSGAFQNVTIIWHGGEPTLVGSDYLDQALSLQQQSMTTGVTVRNSIQTNTTAMTMEMTEVFKRHNVGLGVSIDAPPDIHNTMRVSWDGHSSLPRVLEKIELMRGANLQFGAICVLHRHNYQRAGEIYDFFKSLGLSYHFNPFYKDEGVSDSADADLAITPEQYAEAMIATFDRYIADPEHTIDVTDIRQIMTSMFTGRSTNCLYAGHCEEFVGILPSGDMYLCDMFYRPDKRIGHISTFTAESFTQSRPVQLILTRPQILQQSACSGCEWWNICKGGCPSKAAAIHGDAMQKEPFCSTRKQLFAHMRDSMSHLGT